MATINISEALDIAKRDSVGQCSSCSNLATEDEDYCFYCKSYFEDMAAINYKLDCEDEVH